MSDERPILFSGPMITAILSGAKTQTRRVIRHPQHYERIRDCAFCCPYGQPGDYLWVRESLDLWPGTSACYSADGQPVNHPLDSGFAARQAWLDNYPRAKAPAIHMPRWASRLTLEICSVRVERLQEITREDIEAECPPPNPTGNLSYRNDLFQLREDFRYLWDSINGKKPGHAWADDPFVWVIEFSRLERGEIDSCSESNPV